MTPLKAKNLKEARENLKISKEYYNRNMVIPNLLDLQHAKRELAHFRA